MIGRCWRRAEALRTKDTSQTPEPSDFRKQLAGALPELAASAYEKTLHLSFLDVPGWPHPPNNYLSIAETLPRFRTEFLPQFPAFDPLKRRVIVRINNYPKLLNLRMKGGAPKRAHTIIEEIDAGVFRPEEYEWEQDRLQALFWIPDLIRDPDAIYRKRKGFGVVEADEVYLKVYKKDGSPVKVLFTQRVGPKRDRVVITSYVTSASTAKLYTESDPLYLRPKRPPE